MATSTQGWTLGELAELLGGTLDGPADLVILRPAPADANDPQAIAFAQSAEYVAQAAESGIGAVIIPNDSPPCAKPAIRVAKPRETFGRFLHLVQRPLPLESGIHPTAIVSPNATISSTASVGPYAVIEQGATVGDGVRIYPFSYIGENCIVGNGATIFPHVVLYQDVIVGPKTIIHSGAVLGADGFSFVWDGTRQMKIPQVGNVALGENVEVGANTAIDRAMMGTTRIGNGTKLDDLVMVGHNVEIGEHSVIASQVGLSGSTKIGDRCTFAGQVGTSDHVTVGNDVTLGGRSGVTKDISEPGLYWGLPAMPFKHALKTQVLSRNLPDLVDRLRKLEQKVAELEAKE